jgi:hypothetical protein
MSRTTQADKSSIRPHIVDPGGAEPGDDSTRSTMANLETMAKSVETLSDSVRTVHEHLARLHEGQDAIAVAIHDLKDGIREALRAIEPRKASEGQHEIAAAIRELKETLTELVTRHELDEVHKEIAPDIHEVKGETEQELAEAPIRAASGGVSVGGGAGKSGGPASSEEGGVALLHEVGSLKRFCAEAVKEIDQLVAESKSKGLALTSANRLKEDLQKVLSASDKELAAKGALALKQKRHEFETGFKFVRELTEPAPSKTKLTKSKVLGAA